MSSGDTSTPSARNLPSNDLHIRIIGCIFASLICKQSEFRGSAYPGISPSLVLSMTKSSIIITSVFLRKIKMPGIAVMSGCRCRWICSNKSKRQRHEFMTEVVKRGLYLATRLLPGLRNAVGVVPELLLIYACKAFKRGIGEYALIVPEQ